MTRLQLCFAAAALTLVTAWSGGARADLAPPDACTAGAGTACSNAGTNGDEPGICTATTCPHTGPGPDGGVITTQNPCVLCEPQTGETSSSSSSGGAVGGSGGCAVGVTPVQGAGAMVMLGAGLLLVSRRRGQRRPRG